MNVKKQRIIVLLMIVLGMVVSAYAAYESNRFQGGSYDGYASSFITHSSIPKKGTVISFY